MTLTIALPPDEQKKLSERAAASGQDMAQYVHRLIQRDINQPSFAELLSPVHQSVRESGIQDADLDKLIEDSRHENSTPRPAY